MSGGWIAVIAIGIATVATKAAGPVLLGGRPLPPRLLGVVSLLAPALLAALIATLTLGGDQRLVLDARILGVIAAVVAIAARLPVIGVVLVAAAVTGVARAAGLS
jgi:branched-subunit amino acid transport protein